MGGPNKIVALLILLFFTLSSVGQKVESITVPVESSGAWNFDELHVDQISASNGLLQNTVKDIIRDDKNLTWIITERGVSSYDGKNFIHFSGPGYFAKTFARFSPELILTSDFAIKDGKLIEATIKDSLAVDYHDAVRPISELPMVQGEPYLTAYYAQNGGFYWPSYEKMLFTKESDTIELIDSISFNYNHFFFENRLYNFSQEGVLQQFENDKLVASYFHPSFKNLEGILWCHQTSDYYFLSKKRLYRLNIESEKKVSLELIIDKIPVHPIKSIMIDELNNSIYLGTVSNGIYVLSPKPFRSLYDPKLGKWNNSYSQLEIGQDSIITATGLLFTNDTILKAGKYNRLKGAAILRAKKGDIWTSLEYPGNNDLFQFPTKENIPLNYSKGFIGYGPGGEILTKENSSGLIKTVEGDTFLYNPEFADKQLPHYDSLSESLWFSGHHVVWVYSIRDSKMKRVDHPDDWRFQGFFALNSEMMIAFVREKGLKAYYQNQWHDLPMDKSGNMSYPHCFLEDNKGFFWLSTNNGVFKIMRKELEAYIEGETDQLYYHWFGEHNGIENIELNGRCIPCGLKLESGKFSFPSLNGLLWFKPSEVSTKVHYKDILIRQILIDERDTNILVNSELSQNMDKLEFLISAPFYGHQLNDHYVYYQLEGLSDQWYPVPDDHVISFSKLQYGSYKLNVRRKLGFGIDNYAYNEFSFTVSKYYYQETWFKVLVALSIFLVIAFLFWLRSKISKSIQRRMENEIEDKTQSYRILNEELKLNNAQLSSSENDLKKALKVQERLIELYAHQIRGPLKFMGEAAGQNAQRVEKMNADELKKWFQTISDTSDKMYEQTERLFNLMISNEKGLQVELLEIPILETIEGLLTKFEDSIQKREVELDVKIEYDIMCYGDINMFEIIFNNLIENSINNTQKGFIRIEAYAINNYIVVLIEDNGKGMNPDLVKQLNDGSLQSNSGKGFGLSTVMILLSEMGGYLQVESEISVGTSVSVFLKKHL